MPLPPLLSLPDETAYRDYWDALCLWDSPIRTHDGVNVQIYSNQFEHAFFSRSTRSTAAPKDVFEVKRAERMDWIRAVLQDPALRSFRRMTPKGLTRIVVEEAERYCVVVRPLGTDPAKATFITAYVVDSADAYAKMIGNPLW